jgi:hypothetical protein
MIAGMTNSCGRRPCRPGIADPDLARAKAGEVVLAHADELARAPHHRKFEHRAAYSSVKIETQFGPATSRPEQRARNHHPASGDAARATQETRGTRDSDSGNQRSDVLHDPDRGCSPCAADCTGRLTVGMTRDFADGETRTATASHTCGTSGVLAVKMERPSVPCVRTN